jgi:hypothetical protein
VVIPNPESAPLEVHSMDGQIIAYIVPCEQMDRLRGEIVSLREQLAVAVQQRDHHLAKREELLVTYVPLPPTEEEMKAAAPNSDDIQKLIADLKSR